MTAIEGEALPKQVIISQHPQGMFTVEYREGGTSRRAQGGSLDSALVKAAGENAPEDQVLHCGSILRGILAKAEPVKEPLPLKTNVSGVIPE